MDRYILVCLCQMERLLQNLIHLPHCCKWWQFIVAFKHIRYVALFLMGHEIKQKLIRPIECFLDMFTRWRIEKLNCLATPFQLSVSGMTYESVSRGGHSLQQQQPRLVQLPAFLSLPRVGTVVMSEQRPLDNTSMHSTLIQNQYFLIIFINISTILLFNRA